MRLFSLWTLLVTAGCAHASAGPSTPVLERVEIGGATFHLQYGPEDVGTARQIAAALQRAVRVAERWGTLKVPVRITVHPTHEALEAATHREGYGWLRAWARYGSVDLQSPRTWTRGKASDAAMAQLLAHELTHCVMYQSAGSDVDWTTRSIPIWFREGMATVTAGEGRGGAAAPAGQRPPGPREGDQPGAGSLYRSQPDLVYDAAHQAFLSLLDRLGEDGIRRLIVTMGDGQRFPEAFELAAGIPLQEFEAGLGRLADASRG